MDLDAILNNVIGREIVLCPPRHQPKWSEKERGFLIDNHAKMTDEELSAHLGRSEQAVKIYRVRLGLKAASRAEVEFLTTNRAAELIGVDDHAMSEWCDAGIIKTQRAGENRRIRLIRRRDLLAWCVNPDNWPYFKRERVKDEKVARMMDLRAKRWGDEWWTTSQVAEYHGGKVEHKDVVRHIRYLRTLPGFCLPVSKGGRHNNRRWANWYVRKSDAIAHHFHKQGADMTRFTPRADAWVLRARDELHMPYYQIGRTMHRSGTTIKNRYAYLKEAESERAMDKSR